MDFEKELEKAKLHAERVKARRELYEAWHSNDRKKNALSFSKMSVIFIFVNCIVIEMFSMFAMLHLGDLSALSSLITAVVGQCCSLGFYLIKAKNENCVGGITYETAMKELEYSLGNDDDAVG